MRCTFGCSSAELLRLSVRAVNGHAKDLMERETGDRNYFQKNTMQRRRRFDVSVGQKRGGGKEKTTDDLRSAAEFKMK